ncbi:MAG: hypothetical protein GX050_03810 [Firmicutes bacterium]|nr:hypothetical protein [Bacillota bacterium]
MDLEVRCDVGNCNLGYEASGLDKVEDEMFMELEAVEQLWNREIKSLEEKLRNFRQGFLHLYGYTPEFLSDLLYVKSLKIKPPQI